MYKASMHRTLFAALVVGLALSQSANAQSIGISAGMNFASLDDIVSGDQGATLDRITGWHVHLWFELPLGVVSVRPGLRYMDAGKLFDPSATTGFATFVEEVIEDQFVSYVELPIDVQVRKELSFLAPYVVAGPVVRFTTDPNNKDRLRRFSVAAGVGVGVEIRLVGLRFYPEIRYTFGLTAFARDEYEYGNVLLQLDESQHLRAAMLSLGIGF